MLYSIIPPVLIVVSLVGIIIFLVKKAPEVANLSKEENLAENESGVSKKSFWAKLRREEGEEDKDKKDFNHKMLLFLEKITKKFKVLFLKLENVFAGWGESIRNKRKAREEENVIQAVEITQEKENLAREEKQKDFFSRMSKKEKNPENILEPEKIEVKNKIEKKDILEKILVERIAANPKDIEAYERLGEYYLEIENWNYAKECFKQVLKLNPQNENVKSKMKKLEKMLGK
ncbi:MAG TPA: tetratricopeptide repeat protein [Candidatus Moranbacteria bacterium]|nr:tetratricopeptide repeat protein [Candidatus Moranbacteria bacterium]